MRFNFNSEAASEPVRLKRIRAIPCGTWVRRDLMNLEFRLCDSHRGLFFEPVKSGFLETRKIHDPTTQIRRTRLAFA